MCCLCYLLLGEGPQCDGTEQSGLYAFLACQLDGFLCDACCAAERHDHDVGIVELDGLVAHFAFLYCAVFLLKMQVALFHGLRHKLQRGYDVGLAVACAACRCPRTFANDLFLCAAGFLLRQHHLLHHLSDDTVAKNHCGVAVTERQGEGKVHEIGHLLNRVGGKDNDVVVAIAATACGLQIVALRGLDGS